MATMYVITSNGQIFDTLSSKAKALRIAADITHAADARMAGDVVEVKTERTGKVIYSYVAPVIAEDDEFAFEVYATNNAGEEFLFAYVPNGTRHNVREWLSEARRGGQLTNVRATRYVASEPVASEPVVIRYAILPNGVEIMGSELPRECYYGCGRDVWGCWFDYVGNVEGVCETHESKLSHMDVARIVTRLECEHGNDAQNCDACMVAAWASMDATEDDGGFMETDYVPTMDSDGTNYDVDAHDAYTRRFFIPGTLTLRPEIDAEAHASGVQNADDTAREESFRSQSTRWFRVLESSYEMMADQNRAERENHRYYVAIGRHGIKYVGAKNSACGEPVVSPYGDTLTVTTDPGDVECTRCEDAMAEADKQDGYGFTQSLAPISGPSVPEVITAGMRVRVRPFYHVPTSASSVRSTRSPWTFAARVTDALTEGMFVVEFLDETAPGGKAQAFFGNEIHSMMCRCDACDGEGIHTHTGA